MPYTDQYVPKEGSQEYNEQMKAWDDDKRPQQYAAIAITTFAATVAAIVRLYAQRVYRKGWGLDDLFILIAMFILHAEFITAVLAMKAGAGLHQVRVLYEDNHAPNALQYIFTNYWILTVLWAPGVTFIKLSILVLYRRLFFVQQRWFRITLWINAIYSVALGVATTIVFILQCSPVDYYWTRYASYYGFAPSGKCLPNTREYLSLPQILSTLSDLVILCLPVPVIRNLIISTPRKIAVSAAFLLGAFTIGCGAVRIAMVFKMNNTEDATVSFILVKTLNESKDLMFNKWDSINTITFTVVQAAMGIICACLPPSTPLYTHLAKKTGFWTEKPEPFNGEALSDLRINKRSGPILRIPSTKIVFGENRSPFQEWVYSENRALVWSPNNEWKRMSQVSQVEEPTHGILVQNKIEFSTDISPVSPVARRKEPEGRENVDR